VNSARNFLNENKVNLSPVPVRRRTKKNKLGVLGSILYKMPKAKLIRALISYHTKRWKKPQKNM
jgi:hypothetical protein